MSQVQIWCPGCNQAFSPHVMIWVWACLDQLLTGYDYGTKVCHSVLVMDNCISQRQ